MPNIVINERDLTARRILAGRDFSNQAAGSTAHTLLTNDLTYHQIILNYKRDGVQATEAQLLADIDTISLKLNGVTFRELTATEHMTLAKGMGFTPQAGKLPIFLSVPYMASIASEDVNGVGTYGGGITLSMHVKFVAGAYTPSLSYTAVVAEDMRQPGDVIIQKTYPIDVAGGTYKEVYHLPTDEGDLRALHFFNANITKLEIAKNKVTIFDGDVKDLTEVGKWNWAWTMQAGVLTWSPMFTTRRVHRLPLTRNDNLTVKLTFSAATNSFNVLMETDKAITQRTIEPAKVQ